METDLAPVLNAADLTRPALRVAGAGDFAAIRAVLARCGLFATSVTPQGSTYWLAELGAEAVGCIGLEHGEGASLLRSAAVVPGARSLGVGRGLAQAAIRAAARRGDRALFLFSSDAGDFWRRFGFVPAEVPEVVAALPDSPQVRSGLTRGWIHEEQVWTLRLTPGGPA